jgi:predicted negative regulator of RcsB-dependent stress response
MAREKVDRKTLLKAPDEFLTTTGHAFAWLRDHINYVIGLCVALVIIAAVALGWNWYQNRQEQHAQELQAQAFQLYRNAINQTDPNSRSDLLAKAVARFQEVTQEHAGTKAALLAHIYNGHASYALGEYKQALASYKAALARAPSTGIKAMALQGMGYAYMALKDWEKAIDTFEKLKAQGEAFTGAAQWNIAQCLEEQGKVADALAIYRAMEGTIQNRVHRILVQSKIDRLSTPGGHTS